MSMILANVFTTIQNSLQQRVCALPPTLAVVGFDDSKPGKLSPLKDRHICCLGVLKYAYNTQAVTLGKVVLQDVAPVTKEWL